MVDLGSQEVEVDLDLHDIAAALSEAFARATGDDEWRAGARDVMRAVHRIGVFLNGLSDDHIARLNDAQRKVVADYLTRAAARFGAAVPAAQG
jgi:hypothetical protein